jgi:hypothetical protein
LQQAQPQTQGLPTVDSGPANPNPSALAPQGANVQGDVWAPGTGPSGGYNGYGGGKPGGKGGMPPPGGGQQPGAGGGQQPGGTVGGGWQGAQTGGLQAPTPENFSQMQDAVRQRFGDRVAESYATDNWNKGGQAYAKQKFGDDTAGYNQYIQSHSPGGSGEGYMGLGTAMRHPELAAKLAGGIKKRGGA